MSPNGHSVQALLSQRHQSRQCRNDVTSTVYSIKQTSPGASALTHSTNMPQVCPVWHWVKGLSYKREDLSLDPQKPHQADCLSSLKSQLLWQGGRQKQGNSQKFVGQLA